MIHQVEAKDLKTPSRLVLRSTFLIFACLNNSDNPPSENEIAEVMHECTTAFFKCREMDSMTDPIEYNASADIYQIINDYWQEYLRFSQQMEVLEIMKQNYGEIAKNAFYAVVTSDIPYREYHRTYEFNV